MRRFDPEELRQQIGFIPQETFLFSATLAENIAWGVPKQLANRFEWAAEVAGLGERYCHVFPMVWIRRSESAA